MTPNPYEPRLVRSLDSYLQHGHAASAGRACGADPRIALENGKTDPSLLAQCRPGVNTNTSRGALDRDDTSPTWGTLWGHT